MDRTRPDSRSGCAAVVALAALVGCSGEAPPETERDARPAPSARPAPDSTGRPERIRRAVDDSLRPAEDRARDVNRKPAAVLEFFGIDEGMWVADLAAMDGYYTEILSTLVGPNGAVYAQNSRFVRRGFGKPLAARLKKLAAAGRDNVRAIDAELDEMILPASLDAVLLIRFYHDLFWMPTPDGDRTDRAELLRRVYEALEPGGVFGVIDHHAEAGSGERDALDPDAGLHRIDAELVRREVLAAGFVLEAESDVLSRPDDTRDWNMHTESRRDETDRFVLKFVKPRG